MMMNRPASAAPLEATLVDTYNFQGTTVSMNFGADSPSRTMVAVVQLRGGSITDATVVTIGGETATRDIIRINSGTVFFIARAQPTGTSGDIVISTTGGTSINLQISLFSVSGNVSVADSGTGTTTSPTVTGAGGGVVLAAAGGYVDGVDPSATWANAEEATDFFFGVSFRYPHTTALATDTGPVTPTATFTPSVIGAPVRIAVAYEGA